MVVSTGFTFRQRRQTVDWKKLACVDVDQVMRKVDVAALQQITSNITFCDINAEMEPDVLQPNFVKLFRLAQLIIEYLIYSQDCLTNTIALLEKEGQDLKIKLENGRVKLKERQNKVKSSFVTADNYVGVQNKCAYCPKLFLNETYLKFHVQRRHTEFNVGKADSGAAVENELKNLKERLRIAEERLENARNSTNDRINEVDKELMLKMEIEKWRISEIKNRNKELNEVKEICLLEVKNLNEQFLMKEKLLEDAKRTNELTAESNISIAKQLLLNQKAEMETVKNELKNQVVRVEEVVGVQLKEHEKQWLSLLQTLQEKINVYETENEQKNTLVDVQNINLNKDFPSNGKIQSPFQLNSEGKFGKKKNAWIIDSVQSKQGTPSKEVPEKQTLNKKSFLLHGMREEMSTLLNERLEMMGVPALSKGISEQNFHKKLAEEENNREKLSRKNQGFLSFRQAVSKKVEKMTMKNFRGFSFHRGGKLEKKVSGKNKRKNKGDSPFVGSLATIKLQNENDVSGATTESETECEEPVLKEDQQEKKKKLRGEEVFVKFPIPKPRKRTSALTMSAPDLCQKLNENVIELQNQPMDQMQRLKKSQSEAFCSTPTSVWDSSSSD